jgi:hypothetical protein
MTVFVLRFVGIPRLARIAGHQVRRSLDAISICSERP